MYEKENRFYILKRYDPSELRGMIDSSAVCLKRLRQLHVYGVNHFSEVFSVKTCSVCLPFSAAVVCSIKKEKNALVFLPNLQL